MFCFDTDVLSALIKPSPPPTLVRLVAQTPQEDQASTTITVGELVYGAARRGNQALALRITEVLASLSSLLAFDLPAAQVYGELRAQLETRGTRLADPDLRIASIALAHDLTLVTGNLRHFARVPDLRVENWLA